MEKTKAITVGGLLFEVKVPTVQDEIDIEQNIHIIGKGRHSEYVKSEDRRTKFMAYAVTALSTLSVVVIKCPPADKWPHGKNFGAITEDKDKNTMYDLFDEFEKWRLSFRPKDQKSSKDPPKKDEKQP